MKCRVRLAAALLAVPCACGPKRAVSMGHGSGASSGAGDGGDSGSASADGGTSLGADVGGAEPLYDAWCEDPLTGLSIYALHIRKIEPTGGYCTQISLRFPGGGGGAFDVVIPPDSDWDMNTPRVLADPECPVAGLDNSEAALDAFGTLWWDEDLRFVDVDVTLTLPPAPRWPETDVLRAEGIPVEQHDECPGIYQGGSTGTAGTGG